MVGSMKWSKFYILLFSLGVLVSCGTTGHVVNTSAHKHKKKTSVAKTKKSKNDTYTHSASPYSAEVSSVLNEAKRYLGTPYKYGGTTKSGLDCSGLVINAFDAVGVKMPRISRDQANEGKEIRLRDVREGDLVFFNTSGSNISHVGIVETVRNGEIFFIHSSTSKGVIVSSLEETYWNRRFVKATRVL